MSTSPVAVDAMGGDLAPNAIVQGAIDAALLDAVPVILVGEVEKISHLISTPVANQLKQKNLLKIVSCEDSVAMDEKPSIALRKSKSSMRIACDLVSEGGACGALSAGNSGAMMAISLLHVGRLKGVTRPAIATLMPSTTGYTIVVDVGANVDCTPKMLLEFAVFGAAFSKGVFGIQNPRVGVVSNGEEASKGNELTRESLKLITESSLNSIGYCEGRDIFNGSVDVAVCDGFSGNILLKTAEGTASYITRSLRENVEKSGFFAKIGAKLMAPAFNEFKKKIDAREYGAAPLLGLKAPVFIAHGNSDAYAIRRAISFVYKSHQGHVSKLIEESIKC